MAGVGTELLRLEYPAPSDDDVAQPRLPRAQHVGVEHEVEGGGDAARDRELQQHLRAVRGAAAAGGRGASYRAQMLLKLAVARRVTTAFYLVLDADVLCTRKTGLRDIIVGGRGIFQAEELGTNTRHRREWWDAAGALSSRSVASRSSSSISAW